MTRPQEEQTKPSDASLAANWLVIADDAVLEGQFLRIGVGEQQPVEPRLGCALGRLGASSCLVVSCNVMPLNRSGA